MITLILVFTLIGAVFSLVFSLLAFAARITWGLFRVLISPVVLLLGVLFVAGWVAGKVVMPAALVVLAIMAVLYVTRAA